MGSLCGWLTLSADDTVPSEILAAMTEASRRRRAVGDAFAAPDAALAGDDRNMRGFVVTDEDPWVAIIGTPRWRDEALAEVQRTRGAAQALRVAYLDRGSALLDCLAGSFAFAILDRPARKAILAIDRFGIESLYYVKDCARQLVFGSTADMVRAHPGVGGTVPPQAIYNYLHAFVCRSPGTIYAEQAKLGPGQCLRWDGGRCEVVTYWKVPFRPDRSHTPEELAEELVAQVRRAVHTAVPPGQGGQTGAFLSGGLDSSTVAGLLNEVTPEPARTFTIGFDEESYDEMRYAEATTAKFGTRAHRYYLTAKDTAAMVPKIAAFYDEPFGNSSAVPSYFCAAQARETGMTCLLAGDGGDEILAGNSRYLEQGIYTRFERLPAALRELIKFAAFHTPLLRSTALWQKAQRYITRAEVPLPERLEAFNFYQRERMTEVFDAAALAEIDVEAPWREMRENYESATSEDPLQRMMHLDMKQALADADLKKVTGMCDLVGILVRFPFLDDELVAFCATIPPELHLKDARLRAFFKESFRDFLPEQVIAKKKHGFGMPFYEWTRDDPALRELAYDSLAKLRGRNFLRTTFLDRVMREHSKTERSPFDGLVWDLMVLEQWLESRNI